jgi:hypothetical protein
MPAPSFYFRVCYYSASVSYASLMSTYKQEVMLGGLVGLILVLEGHENETSMVVELPPNFFQYNVDSDLPPIPVLGLLPQDAKKLENYKKMCTSGNQVKQGPAKRLKKWAEDQYHSVVNAFVPPTFAVCELFKITDWINCTPQEVYFKLSTKLNAWKQISDQKEAVLFLKETLKSTGVKHLPIHILAAWSMSKDFNMEADYLQAIYDAAKGEKIIVLEQSMKAYKELVSKCSGFSYVLQAAKQFVQVPTNPVVLAFWSESHAPYNINCCTFLSCFLKPLCIPFHMW